MIWGMSISHKQIRLLEDRRVSLFLRNILVTNVQNVESRLEIALEE